MKDIKRSGGGNGEVGASVGSVRVLIVVMGWILFGIGIHATSKGD